MGVKQRVKDSGLSSLIEHNYRFINYVAVFAFVEQWQPDMNTFHFPFGEITITLDDVKQIFGVLVEWVVLIPNKEEKKYSKMLQLV